MSDVDHKQPQRRALGKGLSALLGDDGDYTNLDRDTIRMVRPTQLTPGKFQPRRNFDLQELEELAASIRSSGVLQPLLVRQLEPKRYEIIAGERRWRAAKMAGLDEIPVIVKELTDKQMLELALIENVQRTDLSAIEEGAGYKRLADEFGYTHEQLAAAIGRSRPHIANCIRLLALPPKVQQYVQSNKLSAGHARALITAPDPVRIAEKVIQQGLNVRQVEAMVQSILQNKEAYVAPVRHLVDPAQLRVIESQIQAAVGLPTKLRVKPYGLQLIINLSSRHDLEGMLEKLTN